MFVSTREMLNQLGDAPQPWKKVKSQELSSTTRETGVEAELHAVIRSLEDNTLASGSQEMLVAALEKAQAKASDGTFAPTPATN